MFLHPNYSRNSENWPRAQSTRFTNPIDKRATHSKGELFHWMKDPIYYLGEPLKNEFFWGEEEIGF